MYAVLGEIEFKVVAFWDGFKSTMGVDYATHARIEGKPGVQFIGDKLDMLALEFSLHSQFCQPTTELNRLREAMLAHKAMALVFGNGDYRGWFVITELTATHQHTDPWGNVIAQNGTMSSRSTPAILKIHFYLRRLPPRSLTLRKRRAIFPTWWSPGLIRY